MLPSVFTAATPRPPEEVAEVTQQAIDYMLGLIDEHRRAARWTV